MFGQPQQSQQQPGASGTNAFGSWGTNTANNATPGTGLNWGQAATQPTPAPTLGGSIFGNPTQQQPQQQQQQQFSQNTPSGGATGGFNIPNTQQPPNQGGSLFPSTFGANNGQNQGQQPSTGSFGSNLFSTAPQPTLGTATTSIFGNKPAFNSSFAQPGNTSTSSGQPASNSLWGNPSSLNNSTFNQSVPPVSVQGQQQPSIPFTRNTRFNDLPDSVQKVFETIDAHIQGRIQISRALKSRSLADEPTKAAETLRRVHNDLVNVVTSQQSDRSIVEEIRSKVDQCVQDTITTTKIIDGFKNSQQNGMYLKDHSTFPLEYFSRAAEEIRQKLLWYKSTIEQIERRLVSAQSQAQYTPQVISSTLQAQNTTFLALAAKTAKLDGELQEIKSKYRELWKAHTGSARDPFNELDRRPGDSEGLLNGIGSFSLNR